MASSKQDLVRVVQGEAGLSLDDAARAVDATLGGIRSLTSTGNLLVLRGFGTFSLRTRKASVTVNPQTGLPMSVPATMRLCFKASKERRK